MSNFPPMRTAVLSGLMDLKDNLEALTEADCPYDAQTKKMLTDLLAPKIIEKVVEKEVQVEAKVGRGRPTKDIKLSTEDQEMVFREIKDTLDGLNDMDTGDSSLPTNERIQIAKTKTNLLDQLLKMLERHTTVQKMEDFKERVIAILEDLVTEADRETFMKRLEPYR